MFNVATPVISAESGQMAASAAGIMMEVAHSGCCRQRPDPEAAAWVLSAVEAACHWQCSRSNATAGSCRSPAISAASAYSAAFASHAAARPRAPPVPSVVTRGEPRPVPSRGHHFDCHLSGLYFQEVILAVTPGPARGFSGLLKPDRSLNQRSFSLAGPGAVSVVRVSRPRGATAVGVTRHWQLGQSRGTGDSFPGGPAPVRG